MMPQFYIEKDDEYVCFPPLSLYLFFSFVLRTMLPFLSLAGHERILSFEMVLNGRFQGTCLHRKVPLVETLPLSVSPDHDLALVGLLVVPPPGSDSPVDQVLVDALVGCVSREDYFLSDTEEEGTSIGLS